MNLDIKNTDAEKYINAVKEYNTDKKRLAAVITLGCQQNEADSEKLRAFAVKMGYTITDEPETANLIVINTCAVRRHAELKALSIVGNFKALKGTREDLVIGVCGCMAAEEAGACVLERRILLIQACQESLVQPYQKGVEIKYVQYFIQKFFHFSHSPRLKNSAEKCVEVLPDNAEATKYAFTRLFRPLPK